MGVITGNIDVQAGSGNITLSDGLLPTANMTLSSIGSMGIEYDIEDNTDDASDIFFGNSELTFRSFDRLSNGDSLFESIDAVPATDPILVDLTFTSDGGRSMDAQLQMFSLDVSYDRIKREVTMKARVDLNATGTIDAVFNNNPSDVVSFDTNRNGTASADAMTANDFIRNTLPLLGRAGATSTFYNITNLSQYFNDDFNSTDGEEGWLIQDRDNAGFQAIDLIYRIAALEGSIVGAIFQEAFIVNRLNTSDDVSVSQGDATKLEISISEDVYSSIKVIGYGNNSFDSWVSKGLLVGTSDNLNPNGSKTLSVYFSFNDYDMMAAEWDSTNSFYVSQAVTTDTSSRGSTVKTLADVPEDVSRFPLQASAGNEFSAGDMFYIDAGVDDPVSIPYIVSNQTSNLMVIETFTDRSINENTELSILTNGSRNLPATRGAESYRKAFGGDKSRRIKIEFLDVDLLQPYQTFTLDSTFPNVISGETFRPSKITYNIENDKIMVEAYQIS